jgi:hypothetical protein
MEQPETKSAVDLTRLSYAVEFVDQCFRRFVSNKRELKTGPRGQLIGCETYRLDFLGFQEAEVNDALIMLRQATNGEHSNALDANRMSTPPVQSTPPHGGAATGVFAAASGPPTREGVRNAIQRTATLAG